MTGLKLILEIVRSRGLLLSGVVCACTVASIIYGILAADRYRAVATLFIDPSALDAGVNGRMQARNSDLDLLRSERVAQRVVENERLIEEAVLRRVTLEGIDSGRRPVEALGQYLSERVDASGTGEGGVVRVAVSLSDPKLAARVANAYAQAWGEVSLELRAASIRSGVERAHQDLVSLRAHLGAARARQGDDSALAAAGARADSQFAQLTQLATQPLRLLGAETSAEKRNASDWKRSGVEGLVSESGSEQEQETGPDNSIDAVSGTDSGMPAGLDTSPGTNAGRGGETSADEEIRLAQQSLERAEERLVRLSAEGIGAPFPAHVLRAAQVPEASSKPTLPACAGFGLALGLILGALAIALAEILDRRVRRTADVVRGLGVVVLGSLPAAASVKLTIDQAARARPSWLRLERAANSN